ncbi:urea transporter [Brucella sp. NBRC 12950]|uniref:urea transporter n=1 Tax=Brucella sp. NBRC 12950 TaxID=2994518 RepID=UPI00249FAB84|nr:urea transporter [Brucella sp. NBRC 12950]GLU28123.1 urea transporter [Brucella sp. NBRC 12950]
MYFATFREHHYFGFFDWTLRGIGQVVFQNNPLSGLIILLAILFNSWVYALICLVGAAAATFTAVLLKAERGLVRDGLYGFNGSLVALALIAFTSADFRTGAVPSVAMVVYLISGAAFSTLAFAATAAVMAPYKVAPLTMPFVLVGWLLLFAILKFDAIDAGPMAKPVSPDQFSYTIPYLLPTWYMGIGTAIGQIFFQDNWITGYIILIGIAVNSRVSAFMALTGASVGAVVAAAFGGPEGAIRDGLFGYNAALTAMALGGFFLVLNWSSFLYAIFGAIIATWLWASIAIFLKPIGMPVLTSTFVIVTWIMLLARHSFKVLVPVEPAEAITAEQNLKQHRVKQGSLRPK